MNFELEKDSAVDFVIQTSATQTEYKYSVKANKNLTIKEISFKQNPDRNNVLYLDFAFCGEDGWESNIFLDLHHDDLINVCTEILIELSGKSAHSKSQIIKRIASKKED